MIRPFLAFAAPALLLLAACQPPAAKDAPAPPAAPAAPASPSGPTVPAPPAAPAAPLAEIPVQFRGEWNAELKACGTGTDDSRLHIEAKTLQFWESSGEVSNITVDGRVLKVTAAMAGEGERWNAAYEFRLSEDGKTITDITDGEGFERKRCP